MDIRKDFSSAALYLERLLLFREEFKKNNLEKWTHLKNKEDFNKIYEMNDDTRLNFERIYSNGRDLSVDMTFKLEEFNNVLEHPSLTSYLSSFYDKNKNFWNIKELEEISLQAKQKRDELGYACPWAVEQMILLFDKQINLLHTIDKTLELIKTTDIYKIENKKPVTAETLDKSRKKKNGKGNKNKDPQNRTQITITIIGTIGVILAALIGIFPTILQSTKETPTPTVVMLIDTPIPPTTSPSLMFNDTFDNNNAGWGTDQGIGDFNTSGYKAYVH